MMKYLLVFVLSLILSWAAGQGKEFISFNEKVYDFGEIQESNGPVSHSFAFVNVSTKEVSIMSVQVACGCTITRWTNAPVQPGASGTILVEFDPGNRPGYFDKSVSVTTNVDGKSINLQITGVVIPKGGEVNLRDFASRNGALGVESRVLNMGRIYINKDPSTKSFKIYNHGSDTLLLTDVTSPDYLEVGVPKLLLPGQPGEMNLVFDAEARYTYGFVTDNIEIHTSDSLMPVKRFDVYATIEEYFPPPTATDLAKAPIIRIDTLAYDLGRARKGTTLAKGILIQNPGKTDLVIRDFQPNCVCIKTEFDPMIIEPGGERTLTVRMDAEGWEGTQQKAITIYSNDPLRSVQRIVFTVVIGN